MDIETPVIPDSFDAFRRRLRAFIAANKPTLKWTPGAGMRVPDDPEDVAKLRTWVRALHDAGYASPRFGDTGRDALEDRIIHQELSAAGIPFVVGNPLVSGAIARFGTDEQRAVYLPAIVRGEHIWTQLFSEPDAGSDLSSLTTRGVRDGDDFVVNGQKVWSTWAQFADFGYLLARTEPVAGSKGISAFVLDMRTPGVTTRPLREITGTTDFNEVFLDDVRIPAANMIGEPGEGWRVASHSLAEERGGLGGGGGGADPIERLLALARAIGRGDDDAVRQDIARLAARSRIQRYLGHAIATRAATKRSLPSDGPVGKIWFSELYLDLHAYAVELEGPFGSLIGDDDLALDGGRWQDAFLYARAWTIGGGSSEIMRNLIAERGLGLPREPAPLRSTP